MNAAWLPGSLSVPSLQVGHTVGEPAKLSLDSCQEPGCVRYFAASFRCLVIESVPLHDMSGTCEMPIRSHEYGGIQTTEGAVYLNQWTLSIVRGWVARRPPLDERKLVSFYRMH